MAHATHLDGAATIVVGMRIGTQVRSLAVVPIEGRPLKANRSTRSGAKSQDKIIFRTIEQAFEELRGLIAELRTSGPFVDQFQAFLGELHGCFDDQITVWRGEVDAWMVQTRVQLDDMQGQLRRLCEARQAHEDWKLRTG